LEPKIPVDTLISDPDKFKKAITIRTPTTFGRFQKIYSLIQDITKSPDLDENNRLLTQGSRSICESYIDDAVKGFSIRIGPRKNIKETKLRILKTLEGFQLAKKESPSHITSLITINFIRNKEGTIKHISNAQDLYVLLDMIRKEPKICNSLDAFDFCGYENLDISLIKEYVKIIQNILPKKEITAHIGEQLIKNNQIRILQNIEELIELGVNRLGHAILLWCPTKYLENKAVINQREEILKKLADNNCILEICPTSNILLTPIGKYSEINIKYLERFSVKYHICTDNKEILQTSLKKERANLGIPS
jgi:adenosine deaminase